MTRARLGAPTLALCLVVLVACSLAPTGGPPVVDGYSLGDLATCQHGCQRFIDAGREWLDRDVPGHRPVVAVEVRWLGGPPILLTRSGGNGDFVVVLHLDDESTRAIMVYCGVGLDPDRCFTMPAGELREPG